MWQDETYSLSELRDRAVHYDELTIEGGRPFALDFLYWAEVIPHTVEWTRRNAVPRTALDGSAIPAGYLAEVAKSWDDDGSADAMDFINMLAFEASDTDRKRVVNETMTDLGRR